jgi:hypothetical protein
MYIPCPYVNYRYIRPYSNICTDFLLPSHFQNLPLPFNLVLGSVSETFPFTLSKETVDTEELGYCHGSCPLSRVVATCLVYWESLGLREYRLIPILCHKCFDPRYQFNVMPATANNINNCYALTTSKILSEIHSQLHAKINRANLWYNDNADTHRLPSANYQPGDMVWLDSYNCKICNPSRTLDNKWHVPVKVLAKVLPYLYRIELPPTMKCHNVQHVLLLDPTANDPYLV